ncbi:MAG: RIP metalloprotease RseP [Gammaproteobacteria bacterium]|nr:RIP metalloprotease RseP [Gammaproteobacteria bacterium]
MTYLFGTLILFLVLVTFHEYGHYSVARFFKIKVLKFSIGFGRDLFNWTNKDGVKFSLSMIPLGGYVAFHDPNDAENYNKLTTEEKKYVLANRPAFEKALVILAGPVFNFILALFTFSLVGLFLPKESDLVSAKINKFDDDKLYRVVSVNDNAIKNAQDLEIKLLDLTGLTGEVRIGLFDYESQESIELVETVENLRFNQEQAPSSYFSLSPGTDYPPRIGAIDESSIADLAGLKEGDLILEVNSNKVFSRYQTIELLNQYGRQLSLLVSRNDNTVTVNLPSKSEGMLYGIELVPERNDFPSSLSFGVNQTIFWIVNIFKFLYKTFTGSMGLDSLSGPVGITKAAGDALSQGLISFLLLLAMLNISLGAFNLLPLPMLDGGQLLFILVEEVKGSPISLKLKALLFNLSYLLIMTLFVFVIINDVMRLF